MGFLPGKCSNKTGERLAPKKSHRRKYRLGLKHLFFFFEFLIRPNMSKGYHFLLSTIMLLILTIRTI